MKTQPMNQFVRLIYLLLASAAVRFAIYPFMSENHEMWVRLAAVALTLVIGAFFVLKGTANVIEETTDVLSKKTKVASGVLQSIGTAFPDMVLGIVAAFISLQLARTDYALAIGFAIIAASTTFGSNIYNVGYAIWCIFRQNQADSRGEPISLIPGFKLAGTVTPIKDHIKKPSLPELDTSIDVFATLSVLTAVVAISMVIFGHVNNPPAGTGGDLYQLVRSVGIILLLVCIAIMYHFRKSYSQEIATEEIIIEEKYFQRKNTFFILFCLALAGVAILLAADSMVNAVQIFCTISGTPFVIAGVLAGVIGCLGEILVVHNYTVNPKGRIGDAVVGVGMDNVVTTLGASIVAAMGGIFLGGNALILIFVLILTLNTLLIWQISKLKNFYLHFGE